MRRAVDDRRTQYVPFPFAWIDYLVPRVVGWEVIATYVVIRRFVWRDLSNARPAIAERMRAGFVVTSAKRSTIAGYRGFTRVETVSAHTTILRRRGWLVPWQEPNGGSGAYDLGRRETTRAAKEREVFFADEWVGAYRRVVNQEVARAHGREARLGHLAVPEQLYIARLAAASSEVREVEERCRRT